MRLTARLRPGKRFMASKIPRGIPTTRDSPVAAPETCNEKSVIPSTSASPESSSQQACLIPSQTSSTLFSHLFFAHSGDGNKERLAELFHTEALDHGLGLR